MAKESLCFRRIEEWLRDDDLFNDHWLTEQTIHGMCSTLRPTELLPDTYLVSATPGLPAGVVCKHYPGSGRPLMYHEGMAHLIQPASAAGFGTRQRCNTGVNLIATPAMLSNLSRAMRRLSLAVSLANDRRGKRTT